MKAPSRNASARQQCVSDLSNIWDGATQQNMMPVDGEEIPKYIKCDYVSIQYYYYLNVFSVNPSSVFHACEWLLCNIYACTNEMIDLYYYCILSYIDIFSANGTLTNGQLYNSQVCYSSRKYDYNTVCRSINN